MPRSTRSASRGISPTRPPGRIANARITRSQSRDLSDNDAAEIEGQKIRRSSRQNSVHNAGSEASKTNRRRKVNRAAEIKPGLSMVEEDVAEDLSQQDEPIPSNSKSTLVTSEEPEVSRSVALPTKSQQLSDLNTDLIIEALPSLNKYSNEIITQIPLGLTPELVTKLKNQLAISDSKFAQRMIRLERQLEASKTNLGGRMYLSNDFILRQLFGTQNPDVESGRPDAIIHKANIAVLLDNLLTKELEVEFMMDLDDVFPTPFISAYYMEDDKYSAIWQDTFNLALEIRTQLALLVLQNLQGRDNFDPDQLIAQIFYKGGEELSTEEILMEGSPRNIAGLSLEAIDEQSERIAERIDEIRQSVFDDTQAHETKEYMNLAELRSKFPWDGFLIRVMEWLQERATEYNRSIERDGGVEKIVEALLEEIPNPDHEITLPFDSPPVIQTSELSSANNATVESAAEKKIRLSMTAEEICKPSLQAPALPAKALESKGIIREHREPIVAESSKAPSTRQGNLSRRAARENIGSDGVLNAPEAYDDYEPVHSTSSPDLKKKLATWDSVEKEKNKENNKPIGERGRLEHAPKRSFFDSQPGAKKAHFDEDEIPARPSKPSHKRRREDADMADESESMFLSQVSEEDPASEDEGFEEDKRDQGPRHRKDGTAAARSFHVTAVPSSKRQCVQPGSSNARGTGSKPDNKPRTHRSEEDEDFDDDNLALAPTQSYRDVNTQAKRQMALSKTRTIQARVPWTNAECEALVDLIREYGNGWSTISKSAEAIDSIQERHRDQVALKDKARNIKVDYLLSGSSLPSNFNLVKLGQKEKEKVLKAGINPYRLEGEEVGEESLDENGDPYE